MTDAFWWQIENVRSFLDAGGPVLWVIIAVAAFIGFLVAERYWYVLGVFPRRLQHYTAIWQNNLQENDRLARYERAALISQAQIQLRQSLPLLKILVALCPLLGLLGTVTGMIKVFEVMAVSGSGNVRAMAAGVSRATVPIMAGMVGALSGVLLVTLLSRRAAREVEFLEDSLTMDH